MKKTYHDLVSEINRILKEAKPITILYTYNGLVEYEDQLRADEVLERIEVSVNTGSEGPTHDPYSFTEFHCIARNGVEFLYHSGLAEYLKIGNDVTLDGYNKQYEYNSDKAEWELVLIDHGAHHGKTIEEIFEEACERKLKDIYDEYQEAYGEDPMGCASDYI